MGASEDDCRLFIRMWAEAVIRQVERVQPLRERDAVELRGHVFKRGIGADRGRLAAIDPSASCGAMPPSPADHNVVRGAERGQLPPYLTNLTSVAISQDQAIVQAHHLAIELEERPPGFISDIGVLAKCTHTLAYDTSLRSRGLRPDGSPHLITN
jgi:hypothetical protein